MRTVFPRLFANWPDYDARKLANAENPSFFNPDAAWEIFYLADKIHAELPSLSLVWILEAIEVSAKNKIPPLNRAYFLNQVLRMLLVMEKVGKF